MRGFGLLTVILACLYQTLADITPLNFHKALSSGDMRHFSRTATGSDVNAPHDRILIPSSFHGSSHQLDRRQTQPEFGTLSNAFRTAIWMWTPDENDLFNALVGNRFFRFTYNPPAGKVPTLGEMMITADNKYALFVNGALVGRSPGVADSWRTAQGYRMVLSPGPVVFAINAANEPAAGATINPAGVLIAIRVTHADGTEAIIPSDAQWLASTMPVPGFELPSTDESQWIRAKNLARFGLGPWGILVTPPTTLTTVVVPGSLPSPSSSSAPLTSSSSTSSSSIPLTSSSSSLTTSSPTSTAFVTITTTAGDQATNAPAASPSSTSSAKSNNAALIGSILGGVVGGFLILLVTLVVLRRRKRKADLAAAAFDTWTPAPHSHPSPESHIKPFMVENTGASVRSDSPIAWQQQQQQQYSTNIDTQYGGQPQPPQAPYRYPPPSVSLSSVSDQYNRDGYQPNSNWGSAAQLVQQQPPPQRQGSVPQALTPGNTTGSQGAQDYYSTTTAQASYRNPYEYRYR